MRLSGHRVAQLSQPSNARSLADLLLHGAAFALVLGVAHAMNRPGVYALAMILVAGLQNRMLIHAHEAWHRKAFSPVRLNQWVGAWIYSYPVGVPFLSDQSRHLAHHRSVGRPEDPDWRDYERPSFKSRSGVVSFLLGQLLGMKVLLRVLGAGRKEIASRPAHDSERRELAGSALCQLLLLACFAVLGRPWEYLVLWVLPLGTVASFSVALRAFVEHAHLDPDVDPHERLYDFSAGPLTRFFLSPLLFHLHALHHAYPSVPYHRLRELQAAVSSAGASYPAHARPGYLRSLLRYLGELEPGSQSTGKPT